MIEVNHKAKIIFFRGPIRYEDFVAEVERILGKRWAHRKGWLVVGLADDDSRLLQVGMPFTPPHEDREPAGFKYKK